MAARFALQDPTAPVVHQPILALACVAQEDTDRSGKHLHLVVKIPAQQVNIPKRAPPSAHFALLVNLAKRRA